MWSLILYVVCVCMCIYVVFCKIDHCIHIHWCIVMGLGHNDPWVESHMWPQQTWGQRSSRGQWPLVQVFGKKGQCIHILWCIFNLIYYNECKRMWSRKQVRHMVREPPCLQTISIVKFEALFHWRKSNFIPFNILCRTLCGEIHVTWELLDCGTPSEQGIVGYDISWINMADGSEETASVSHAESSYDVPVYTQG